MSKKKTFLFSKIFSNEHHIWNSPTSPVPKTPLVPKSDPTGPRTSPTLPPPGPLSPPSSPGRQPATTENQEFLYFSLRTSRRTGQIFFLQIKKHVQKKNFFVFEIFFERTPYLESSHLPGAENTLDSEIGPEGAENEPHLASTGAPQPPLQPRPRLKIKNFFIFP